MVNLHGRVRVSAKRAAGMHNAGVRPADPTTLLKKEQLEAKALQLLDWWQDKRSVLCITGAGLSTDSGIPDYRGHKGSYHKGHKPIIHQQYMENDSQRKRYWGRSMVGWSKFDSAKPNKGHFALASLERQGALGVTFDDQQCFYEPKDEFEFNFSSGQRELAIVTQNVDSLHQRAGSRHVLPIHGRGGLLKCMQCGYRQQRNDFHSELEEVNREWLFSALKGYEKSSDLRPDGDAIVKGSDYNDVCVPNCPHCHGVIKPDVVFFGDTVPKHRVRIIEEAIKAADGVLVIGSSLAVHSAFRHVRSASQSGIPIAIVNVGETRAETEGLENILKVEAPASDTLAFCAKEFEKIRQ